MGVDTMRKSTNFDALLDEPQEIIVTFPSPVESVDQMVLTISVTCDGLTLSFYEDGIESCELHGPFADWYEQAKGGDRV